MSLIIGLCLGSTKCISIDLESASHEGNYKTISYVDDNYSKEDFANLSLIASHQAAKQMIKQHWLARFRYYSDAGTSVYYSDAGTSVYYSDAGILVSTTVMLVLVSLLQ